MATNMVQWHRPHRDGHATRTLPRLCRLLVLPLALAACDGWAAPTGPVTPATLDAFLKAARPGDTLRLQPGQYGLVTLPPRSFSPPLRIDADQAVFTGLTLTRGSGITITGGRVVGPGNAKGYAILLDHASRITIERMTIGGAQRGIVVNESEDVSLIGNRLDGLIVDGIDMALSRRVLVKGNSCRNFNPRKPVFAPDGTLIRDGDHPDCIQAWSRPTAPPSADLTIVENDIEGHMQGIFLGDGQRQGVPDGGFDRIAIKDNRVKVGYPNGIVAYNLRSSNVSGNIVETLPGARLFRKPEIMVKANLRAMGDVTMCGNRVPSVPKAPGQQRCPR